MLASIVGYLHCLHPLGAMLFARHDLVNEGIDGGWSGCIVFKALNQPTKLLNKIRTEGPYKIQIEITNILGGRGVGHVNNSTSKTISSQERRKR